jgi:hypothetical protein
MAKAPSQLGPIRSSSKFREFRSLAAIGKRLIADYPAVEWPAGNRTLETQLNKLDKGDAVWWRNKPAHAECLAKLLDIELLDLGLTGQRLAYVVEFSGFPGMPPLDLRRNEHWKLGREKPFQGERDASSFSSLDEWFSPSPGWHRPPSELNWLCVEDALERWLLVKKLEIQGNYQVVLAKTLPDAVDRLASSKPLIFAIGELSGDADFASLALRPDGVGLLVIAPHMLPTRTAAHSHEYFGWERMGLRGREAVAFDLSASVGGPGSMKRWTWEHLPDWRNRLLKWVERHFSDAGKDSLYSAEGLQAWLDRFDPREEWFQTSSDLLSLCLSFDGEKKLPKAHDAQAGGKLLKALKRNQLTPQAEQLHDLCLARWQCKEVTWDSALSQEVWCKLMPHKQQILSDEDLDAIVHSKTEAQRKQAAEELKQRLERGSPQVLLQSGLLRQVGFSYDFQHRSLVNLLVRDQLLADMVHAPLSEWAWACFDIERCRLVDAALDALSLEDIQGVVTQVVAAELNSTESIGASEAIFYAIGRRIANREEIPNVEAFLPLAQCVIARLNMDDIAWSLPAPWSRSIDAEASQLEWISACWAWSLMPNSVYAVFGSWLFPGWTNDLPEPPWWLTTLWPTKDIKTLPQAWKHLFNVAEEWVKDVEAPVGDAPRILQMAYLAKAASGGWAAQSSWWSGLIHLDNIYWLDEMLIGKFGRTVRIEAAKRLWLSYVNWEAADKTMSGSSGTRSYWRVRRWMLESLPASIAIDALDIVGRVYLASCPHTLPPQVRGALLLSVKGRWETIPVGEEDVFLRNFGSSIVNELEQLLGHGFVLGQVAATLLWEWNPGRAGELLMQAEGLSQKAWSELFYACPATHLSIAIDAVQANQTGLDLAQRKAWIKQRLPASGGLAPRLLALLHDTDT